MSISMVTVEFSKTFFDLPLLPWTHLDSPGHAWTKRQVFCVRRPRAGVPIGSVRERSYAFGAVFCVRAAGGEGTDAPGTASPLTPAEMELPFAKAFARSPWRGAGEDRVGSFVRFDKMEAFIGRIG